MSIPTEVFIPLIRICSIIEGYFEISQKIFNSQKKTGLRVIKYFNKKSFSNGVLFVQETHSTSKDKIFWVYEFNAECNAEHIAPQIHA